MARKLLSVIIPAFNEEECLSALLSKLDEVIRVQLLDIAVEVIIVDDHSNDDTPRILEETLPAYPWLNYIRLLKNSGSHVAILAGLSVCRGDMAFIMGADLQDPPEIIADFIEQQECGFKIILGEREGRGDPLLKRLPSSLFNHFMNRFVFANFPVNGGDVFLIDRGIISAVLQCEEKNVNIFVLILSLCSDVGTVNYKRQRRYAGVSKWNVRKLFKLAYDSVITVGYLPLKVIFWVGLTAFMLSVMAILYLLTVKLLGIVKVEGWASTLVAIMAFGGLNMISISVLGEYLWRNFDQTRKRPIFIIEKSHLNQSNKG